MSSSRERHAREWAAKAGESVGVSRESVRQAMIVAAHAPELGAEVAAGTLSVNAAYREAIGDDRVPMYIKLEKDTDEFIRSIADELGMSRQQVVGAIIRNWVGEHRK